MNYLSLFVTGFVIWWVAFLFGMRLKMRYPTLFPSRVLIAILIPSMALSLASMALLLESLYSLLAIVCGGVWGTIFAEDE